MFDLKNKTAVVTGSGSGIGKAVALLLAKQGANVHLLDLNPDGIKATAEEIKNNKGNAWEQPCDVTNQQQVNLLFEKIGKVDILVNSAGVSHVGNIENTSSDDMDRLYQVNVKGVYHCLQAAVKIMLITPSRPRLSFFNVRML